MVLETVRPSSGSLALVRTLSWQGRKSTSVMDALNTVENADSCSVAKLWELAVLRGAMPESAREPKHRVRVVDLFCGVGGLSAGLVMAGRLTGINVEPSLAVDLDMAALQVFHNNHATARILHANVDSLLDYSLRFDTDSVTLAYPPEILEHVLSRSTRGRRHCCRRTAVSGVFDIQQPYAPGRSAQQFILNRADRGDRAGRQDNYRGERARGASEKPGRGSSSQTDSGRSWLRSG